MGKRRYGSWSGNERGTLENGELCIVEVWPIGGGFVPHQCRRYRGYGDDGLYCKQHSNGRNNTLETGMLATVKHLTKEGNPPSVKMLSVRYKISMIKVLAIIEDFEDVIVNVAIMVGGMVGDLDMAEYTVEYMGED